MRRRGGRLALIASAIALAIEATGCESSPCGDGTPARVGDVDLCAYEASVVIVSGFRCPSGYDVRLDDPGGGVICATGWVDAEDLPDDVCMQVDCSRLRVHVDPGPPECEGLGGRTCLSPWPSDRYRDADRGVLSVPLGALGSSAPVAALARLDGFAPSTPIAVALDVELDPSGLPDEEHVEISVSAGSPTVVLDATTGERVPHVAEIDRWSDHGGRTTLWIRPLRLEPGHRVVVGLRGLRDAGGRAVRPGSVFLALREGLESDSPEVNARRERYRAEVFPVLEAAGVDRRSLVLAWDFTVASAASARSDLDTMIALARDDVARAPVSCDVGAPIESGGFVRARGTLSLPGFLETDAPGAALARDAGRPVLIARREVPFELAIPSGAAAPVPVVFVAHLIGGDAATVVRRDGWTGLASSMGAALVAIDLAGATGADLAAILARAGSDPFALGLFVDGGLQAAVDAASAIDALPACAADPDLAGVPALDTGSVTLVASESTTISAHAALVASPAIDGVALIGPSGSFGAWARRSSSAIAVDETFERSIVDPVARDLTLAVVASLWAPLDPVAFAPELASRRTLAISDPGSTRAPAFLARLTAAHWDLPWIAPSVVEPSSIASTGYGAARGWVVVDTVGDVEALAGATRPPLDRALEPELPRVPALRTMLARFLRAGGVIEDTCGGACDFVP